MAEYIRAKINYVNSRGEVEGLGDLSVAVWGEPEQLAKQIAQHYNLPDGEYDLYMRGPDDKPIKSLKPDELNSIILVPRYSGPLIKP